MKQASPSRTSWIRVGCARHRLSLDRLSAALRKHGVRLSVSTLSRIQAGERKMSGVERTAIREVLR